MTLKNQLKQAQKALQQKRWNDLATIMRSVADEHGDSLSYEQCFMAAQVLHNKDGYQQLSLELAQLALTKDSKRVEAPEIMYFIFFSSDDSKNLQHCHEVLDLLFENSSSQELTQKYFRWLIYLANKEGNHRKIVEAYLDEKVEISRDLDDLSQIVFAVVMALLTQNMIAEARKLTEEFIPIPDDGDGNQLNCHAKLCAAEGNIEKALEYFTKVQGLADENTTIEATWNKSLLELASGRLNEGWSNYEIRWAWNGFPSFKPTFSIERWQGNSLKGKSILLWGEQGIGDELLFSTLTPEVLRMKPDRIGFALTKKLHPIMRSWFPEAELFPLTDLKNDIATLDANFDYQLPVGSLPLATKQFSAGGEKRYLGVGPSLVRLKESIIAGDVTKYKRIVGVSWRSGALTYTRVANYLSVNAVVDLISGAPKDTLFVALQYGITDEERGLLEQTGQCFIPQEDLFNDVLVHSAYVRCCDLIVTSSSVCLALAGICNIPTVTWGPKTMWTLLGGGSSSYPWFPNVHYIRCETAWDLGSLIAQIKRLLTKYYGLS